MNKEITIYELLGLIKEGKAPKMIKYKGNNYMFTGYDYHCILTNIEKGFVEYRLIKNYIQDLQSILNEKVEIIEEDKDIEEIKIENDNSTHFYIRDERGTKCGMTKHSKMIAEKLNELIKEVNKLRKEIK